MDIRFDEKHQEDDAEKTTVVAKVPTLNPQDGNLILVLEKSIQGVRNELMENPYVLEALKVIPVGGYRSAIGALWNAVVDDLRNKVMHRSLSSFNREVKLNRDIKTYEDFQEYLTDEQLIEGAYKIGVIGWEARKMLQQAKQTRHIFSGHPRSSEPTITKVLAMMEDCVKYVLSQEFPPQIVDIDDYMTILTNENFDRNEIAVENALGDLPETYKEQLIHRVFKEYIHPDSGTGLRGNIEFVAPIFWKALPKNIKINVVRQVDSFIQRGDKTATDCAFTFVKVVDGTRYLSVNARKYKLKPIIQKLMDNLDKWEIENECVKELRSYAGFIPPELIFDYVSALTHTYVGCMGHSSCSPRTDFYANAAAPSIQIMFTKFDDSAATAFVDCITQSSLLQSRIGNPTKMRRLRSLGNILLELISDSFDDKAILNTLGDETKEKDFLKCIKTRNQTPMHKS